MTATLSGCLGRNPNTALQLEAGRTLGLAAARVNLPAQPAECGQAVPHAALAAGSELRSVLRRERGQLNAANARGRACFTFNEDLRARLAGTGKD